MMRLCESVVSIDDLKVFIAKALNVESKNKKLTHITLLPCAKLTVIGIVCIRPRPMGSHKYTRVHTHQPINIYFGISKWMFVDGIHFLVRFFSLSFSFSNSRKPFFSSFVSSSFKLNKCQNAYVCRRRVTESRNMKEMGKEKKWKGWTPLVVNNSVYNCSFDTINRMWLKSTWQTT